MTTREGRREFRPGPPVAADKKVEATDFLTKEIMQDFYDTIQRCLVVGFQGEVKAIVTIFDGGVTRCHVESGQTKKFCSKDA